MGIHYSGVQSEGAAADGGSIMQYNNIYYDVNHFTQFQLHPPLMNLDCRCVADSRLSPRRVEGHDRGAKM